MTRPAYLPSLIKPLHIKSIRPHLLCSYSSLSRPSSTDLQIKYLDLYPRHQLLPHNLLISNPKEVSTYLVTTAHPSPGSKSPGSSSPNNGLFGFFLADNLLLCPPPPGALSVSEPEASSPPSAERLNEVVDKLLLLPGKSATPTGVEFVAVSNVSCGLSF